MSASLVGSEMCIRDSPRAAWGCSGERWGLALLLHWGSLCCAPLLDSAWPVSYTHLTLPTICSV
eukprot:814632-Alexandrium_andersonii.AAC.1